MELVYPGLEVLKQSFKRGTFTEGQKVFGRVSCGRCQGTGTYWNHQGCYGCGGSGIKGELRIDEAGWTARMKAQAKAEIRKQNQAQERMAKAQATYDKNCAALGRDVDAVTAEGSIHANNPFLRDVLSKSRLYILTEKQVDAIKASIVKGERMKAERDELAANGVMAAAGRYEITGKIIVIKESYYCHGYAAGSYTLKMLVQDSSGAKFYGSVPSNIQPKKDDVISFTATVAPKEPGFSYFTRPVKGVVKQMGAESQRLDDIMAVKADCMQAAEAERG